MRLWDSIGRYGRKVTVCTDERPGPREIRAFVQPIRPEEYTSGRKITAPGYFDKRTYLLTAPPDAFANGEKGIRFICSGVEYELLRAEMMFVGDEATHWEGVLRPVGSVPDV